MVPALTVVTPSSLRTVSVVFATTVMVSSSVLSPGFTSAVSLVVVAMLVIEPSASGAIETRMVTVTLPPEPAILPSVHSTVPALSIHASGELTNVNSGVNGSVITTLDALNVPMLVTVMV